MARRATNVTRGRIHAEALARFRTRGYEATSLQEIADALDVTKAALYYHVPSKAGLLHDLADPFLAAVNNFLGEFGEHPLDIAGRRALLSGMIDVLLAHQGVVAWLVRDVSVMAHEGVAERIRGDLRRLQQLLAGADLGEPWRVRVAAAVGALVYPFTILDDGDLTGEHDPLLAAALGALGAG